MNLIKAKIAKHLGVEPQEIREIRDWEPKGIFFVIITGRRPTFVSRKKVLGTLVSFKMQNDRGSVIEFTIGLVVKPTVVAYPSGRQEAIDLAVARKRWLDLARSGYRRVA
jgi:hypothetical protein